MYTCPMHPEITSTEPGYCSKCGMSLVAQENSNSKIQTSKHEHATHSHLPSSNFKEYWPLIVVIGMISLVTIVMTLKDYTTNQFSLMETMRYFMAGFFLVFSGFKLLDPKGFVEGYKTYDLIAKKFPVYGWIYPYLELFLGLAYLVNFTPLSIHVFTGILMFVSGIGVVTELRKNRHFQCACLGTVLKVPLTKITLIEDFGMAIMAVGMIFLN